ncbi:MAG TPA: NifB/NifX family molybdenum-iron cluster-binding protein [Anaerolineales bacterium]|nr:NifB/NifX family molybdenum-iron cluster-binding protein [Anaerolineales bacterium]
MKIILTATSPNIDSNIDPRFGRGAYFIIVDPDSLEWQAHANPAINASGGAGSQAAQFAAGHQVGAIISGDFGPNAYNALQTAGIAMNLYGDCHTVREAIDHFKAGSLTSVNAPTGPGHHGA